MNAINNNLCRTVLFFCIYALLNTTNPLHGMHKGRIAPDGGIAITNEVNEAIDRLFTSSPRHSSQASARYSSQASARYSSQASHASARHPSQLPDDKNRSTPANEDILGSHLTLPLTISFGDTGEQGEQGAACDPFTELLTKQDELITEQDTFKRDIGTLLEFLIIETALIMDEIKKTRREADRNNKWGPLSCFFSLCNNTNDDDLSHSGPPSTGSMVTRRPSVRYTSTPDGVRNSSNALKEQAEKTEADQNQS